MAVVRAFNSLKSFERLKSSGVSEEQARIFVDIFEQVTTNSVEHLASKEDLHNTEASLKKDVALIVAETRTELKEDIAGIKAEMRLLKSLIFGVFGVVTVNIVISLMHIH